MMNNNKSESQNTLTAAILVIGNEILSGMIQDQNVRYIAQKLLIKGISLKEVRIIPDIEQEIIENVNYLRKKYSYLFSTGGIGPTHDDITTSSVAKAFGVNLVRNDDIYHEISKFYEERGETMNSAREKMSILPENSSLISNSITKAPGFFIENVFVMAGIPAIVQDMFTCVESNIKSLTPILLKHCIVNSSESIIASLLEDVQNNYPNVDIGSYPFKKDNNYYTNVAFKTNDLIALDESIQKLRESLDVLKISYE